MIKSRREQELELENKKLKKEVEETKNSKLTKTRYNEVKQEYITLLENWKAEFNEFMEGRDTKYYDEERKLINL